jgi:hypothetical protein
MRLDTVNALLFQELLTLVFIGLLTVYHLKTAVFKSRCHFVQSSRRRLRLY